MEAERGGEEGESGEGTMNGCPHKRRMGQFYPLRNKWLQQQ